VAESPRNLSLFAYGFRPFFLAAGLAAVVLMLVWLVMSSGGVTPPGDWTGTVWHGHEMLFGYALAVIAGFMLTAVPNWVGGGHLAGGKLAALVALWLAGRVLIALADVVPAGVVAAVDCAFPVALAVVLAPMPIAKRQWRNLPLLVLLLLLALTNLRIHSTVAGWQDGAPGDALLVALDIVLMLVLIMGGRVVPAFTRNFLRQPGADPGINDPKPLIIVAVAAMLVVGLADTIIPDVPLVAGLAALVAGVVSTLRLARWRTWAIRGNALLWILHAGYAALAAGLMLRGVAVLTSAVPVDLAVHVLTVGAVGITTLAMLTRVSLGHTGRAMRLAWPVVVAYGMLIAAAIVRLAAPVLPDTLYTPALHLSGVLWAIAFALFVLVYAPILIQRRPDGKPG